MATKAISVEELTLIVTLSTGQVGKVPIEATKDVFDLRKVVKANFSPLLGAYAADQLAVMTSAANGTELLTLSPLGKVLLPDENGKLGVFVVVPPNPPPTVAGSIEELLKEKKIDIDGAVLRRMLHRFATGVALAMARQDAVLAMDIYNSASKLPGPTTIKALENLGVKVYEQLISGNPSISTCLKNGEPRVLKFITAEEHARQAIAVDANVKFDPSNHLVPFEVLEHKEGELSKELSKECIFMPCYNFTLSLVLSPTLPIKKLWNEMKVAVTYLHSMGFAHADIKPDNIFIGPSGEYLLGDHGSIAKFGCMTQSTPEYVPSDISAGSSQRASPALDWWMLAKTLLEASGFSRTALSFWGRQRVKQEIQNLAKELDFLQELYDHLEQDRNN